MPGFCICNRVLNKLRRVLNKLLVLNMPGLRIWQSRKYARVIQGAEFG